MTFPAAILTPTTYNVSGPAYEQKTSIDIERFVDVERLIEASREEVMLKKLKLNIGDELFNNLSSEQKNILSQSMGSVDLGGKPDEKRMNRFIDSYEPGT